MYEVNLEHHDKVIVVKDNFSHFMLVLVQGLVFKAWDSYGKSGPE